MSLKLFRSTGFSSILTPGEARAATHPGWIVLATSLWSGFACNVALWRAFRALPSMGGVGQALLLGVFVGAASGLVLSLLGWRKTLKPAAVLVLFLAALSACAIWSQGVPLGAGLASLRPTDLIPSWPSLLRWQVSLLLAVLSIVPAVWVGNVQMRRLSKSGQRAANALGMLVSVVALGASGFLLLRV